MTVQEALAAGELDEALRLQRIAVVGEPSARQRLLLAELLLIAGEFPAASDEVKAIRSDNPAWPASRRQWLGLIRAANRREQFRRSRHPLTAELPRHARHRLRAVAAVSAGDAERAVRHLDVADETSPELSGHADGQEFEGVRDLDSRYASVLEFLTAGRYLVIPLERLRSIHLRPAVGLADTVFRPAELCDHQKQTWHGHLPLVYPGSRESGGSFALGIDTDFRERDPAVPEAVGARTWILGDGEVPLGECRRIDLPGTPLS